MAIYQNILLAADLIDSSNHVVDQAKYIAQVFNANVTAAHVIEPIPMYGYPWAVDIENPLKEEAENELAKIGEKLNIPKERQIVEFGSIKHQLLKVAEDHKNDLIITGSHGRHGWHRLLGSGANAVVNYANSDVLIVRCLKESQFKKYQRILLATEMTPQAKTLVKKAMEVAEQFQSRLQLIHVVEPITHFNYAEFIEFEEEYQEKSKVMFTEFAKELHIAESDLHVGMGPVKREILDTAKKLNTDLIIVGSHGQHGLNALLGSTASAVLHGAECDVLTIRCLE
ncbi:MAG: universal stress protein [Proteobacteria bacterium]|nr:universal stress protein [Pseudomonadota bacterium]